MSFLFFGKKKSQLVKQSESALHMAQKVINYRRDVLAPAAVAELEANRAKLEWQLALYRGKQSAAGKVIAAAEAAFAKADAGGGAHVQPAAKEQGQGGVSASTGAGLGAGSVRSPRDAAAAFAAQDKQTQGAQMEQTVATLAELLSRHGGRIYPNTFASENIEMLVVAAILAIGIRSFFFQPFKIPTNSMWPTYAGMIPVVYPLDQERPNTLERLVNRALYWSKNFYVTAPAAGELLIPVMSLSGDSGQEVQLLREAAAERQLFGLREVPQSRYLFSVGDTNFGVSVPQDFPLEPVVLKSYFPEYGSWAEVLSDYRRKGMVEVNTRLGTKMPVYVIRTGIVLKAGDPVLDFDIKTGDMLFVDRMSYNFVRPKIGDPIVFRTDNIPGLRTAMSDQGPFLPDERYYIKRLVGIGGDTVQVQGSTLLINGQPAQGAAVFGLNALKDDGIHPGYQARWRLANGKTDTVSPGYFYAMGDNSPESYDSRGWGYDFSGHYLDKRTREEKSAGVPANQVPERDVVGKAMFIFYPLESRWGPAK